MIGIDADAEDEEGADVSGAAVKRIIVDHEVRKLLKSEMRYQWTSQTQTTLWRE